MTIQPEHEIQQNTLHEEINDLAGSLEHKESEMKVVGSPDVEALKEVFARKLYCWISDVEALKEVFGQKIIALEEENRSLQLEKECLRHKIARLEAYGNPAIKDQTMNAERPEDTESGDVQLTEGERGGGAVSAMEGQSREAIDAGICISGCELHRRGSAWKIRLELEEIVKFFTQGNLPTIGGGIKSIANLFANLNMNLIVTHVSKNAAKENTARDPVGIWKLHDTQLLVSYWYVIKLGLNRCKSEFAASASFAVGVLTDKNRNYVVVPGVVTENKIQFGILGCAKISQKISMAIRLSPNSIISASGSLSLDKAPAVALENNFSESAEHVSSPLETELSWSKAAGGVKWGHLDLTPLTTSNASSSGELCDSVVTNSACGSTNPKSAVFLSD
ncbi:hypothetical protein Tco_0184840 [Tanacetum coccineum]